MDPYVLIVDDFPDGRDMLAEYLTFRGFAVETANDGREAIAIATSRPPAVILLDLTMPGMDGWSAARQLKSDIRTEACIVIAVTANALSLDDAKARAAGCDGFVAKPFDLTALGDAVANLMSGGRVALADMNLGQAQPSPTNGRAAAS